jgi:hypothetical protein
VLSSQVLPYKDVMALTESQGTFFLFGSFCVCMSIFAYVLIPETKGLSLEKMDELFGVTDAFAAKAHEDPEKVQAVETKRE